MNPEPFILAAGILAGGFGVWWFLRHRALATPESGERITTDSKLVTADSFIVGDVDSPLITVTPLATPALPSVSMPDSARLASNLEPLLNRAPELLRLGHDMTTKTLRVVFSPEVTRSLQSGSLAHVQDAANQLLPVARDARTGRFVEVGRAVKTGGVRLANVAAATWQIAAIATAQHYLGEINARLQRIEDRVADIYFFLIAEKRGELRAAIHLLRQYHDAIARGELHANETTAIYQKLEDLEHTCLAIGELARESARNELDKLESLEIKEYRAPASSLEVAKGWVKQSQEALELVFLAQSCRVLGCQVKAMLPGDRALLRQRIAHAKDEVRTAAEQLVRMYTRFQNKVIEPLNPNSDFFRKVLPYDDHRPEAERAFAGAGVYATELTQQFDAQAVQVEQFAEQFDQLTNSGMALDVRFNAQGAIEILSVQPA